MPLGPELVEGTVVEPLPNGLFRVELVNGVKVLAYVADRVASRFARLRAGDAIVGRGAGRRRGGQPRLIGGEITLGETRQISVDVGLLSWMIRKRRAHLDDLT